MRNRLEDGPTCSARCCRHAAPSPTWRRGRGLRRGAEGRSGMVLSPAAARRRHAAGRAAPGVVSRSDCDKPGIHSYIHGAEFDTELASLASAFLAAPEVVPVKTLADQAGMVEAVSTVAEDARYRGRLDERQEAQRLAQQQQDLHQAELKAMQVKADLEAESLKMEAKLEMLKTEASARQEADERAELLRQRAEAERRLRQEAEAEAFHARARAAKLETEQREAERRRLDAEKSAEQQLRDEKRKLAAVETRLQEDAAEEQRWKEHVAALRIQGVERVRQARRELERVAYEQRREAKRLRNAAATNIQAVYRGHLARVRNSSALATAMGADKPFQNVRSPFARAGSLFQHAVERQWRGGSVASARWKTAAKWHGEEVPATWQEVALETALVRGSAALLIQSYFRGWHARQHQVACQQNASIIQRTFRGWTVRNHLRQTAAATIVQGVFRGRMVRRWLSVEMRAATLIQARWRGWLLRDQRSIALTAATIIQAGFRGWKTRIWLRELADAATVLQASTRGMQVRKQQRMQGHAAIEIQRHCRGWHARHAIHIQQWAMICIQKTWRGVSCRQWLVWNISASNLIAAAWRGYVLRRDMRRCRDATVQIQRRWRGTAARRELASQQRAVICIQRIQRGRLGRRIEHQRHRSAMIMQSVARAHLVQSELIEHIAAARMMQAMARGYLARSHMKLEFKAAQTMQAVQRGRAVRQAMATMRIAAGRIQASFRGWILRRELSSQVRCAIIIQAICRAHLGLRQLWTEHKAATYMQKVWRGVLARQEARRCRLAKERYRAAQLAEFDRMRAELEAEATAESEAAQIAREARLRMAVDAVETVFPRPQDADYHIRARHDMARSILGCDVLSEENNMASVNLRHDDCSIADSRDLEVAGLNSESKLPGIGSLFVSENSTKEESNRPHTAPSVPRPSEKVIAAPAAGIGLYPPSSVQPPNFEWSTTEIRDGVTLTTQSGPSGGKSLMHSGALATSMRGRLLRDSLQQLENNAATTIQRNFRGWQARADMLLQWDAMQAQHNLETQAATLIQASYRGIRTRKQLQHAWSTPLSSAAQLSVIYDFDSELSRGLTLMQASRYTEAMAAFELCHAMRPDASLPPYYLAGCLSAMSDIKTGIKWLDIAVLLGMDINELMRDPDLKKLRYHPELEVHYGTAQLRYEAAVRLQAVVRGGLTRSKVERTMWKELQAEAAACIQSAVRGWSVRRNLCLQIEAKEFYAHLVRLQAYWRGQLCRRELQRQAKAVTTIAAYQRMRMVRQMYVLVQRLGLETNAATRIQRIWRGTHMRREFQAMQEQAAVIVMQKAYRGWTARRQMADDREVVQRDRAALLIQAIWRGHAKRQDLLRQMRNALDELDRDAATTIQAAYRGWSARRLLAAQQTLIRIQAMWRGTKVRRSFRVELKEARRNFKREQAAIQIQATFRGWVVRTAMELERCLASLVSMQAIRRGTVARKGVGRMQLRELQERERLVKDLEKQREHSEQRVIKIQARLRGRIARRQFPSRRRIDKAAQTLQVLLRTVLPREELIARKLRARAAMESTLFLQAEDEMKRSQPSVPPQAAEAVVQVALDVMRSAESAATRCLPSDISTDLLHSEPLSASDCHTIVAAESHSENESDQDTELDEQNKMHVSPSQIVVPTPHPNDWAASVAREQQQQQQQQQQHLPSATVARRPPRPGTRKKKVMATKERLQQLIEQNPFGPTASLYSTSTNRAIIRQRSNSVPNPIIDQAPVHHNETSPSGTRSVEASLPQSTVEDQRPHTSPGARQSNQQESGDSVANIILNWSNNLGKTSPESVAPPQSGSLRGNNCRQTLLDNPVAPFSSEAPTKARTHPRPGANHHIVAAANIREYLTVAEGSVEEAERSVELTNRTTALQMQRSWPARIPQPLARKTDLVFDSTALPTDIDGRALLQVTESQRRRAAHALKGTPQERSNTLQYTGAPGKKKRLPALAQDEQQQGTSTRLLGEPSFAANGQPSAHSRRSASHSRNKRGKRGKRTDGVQAAAEEQYQHPQMRRPETPEQALAKLVSPSELNASLPPRRDRRVSPAEHLDDALAGTWGHVSLRSGGGASYLPGSKSLKKKRGSSAVVSRRWEPRDADAENTPFVKSLERKYGTPPDAKQRSSTADVAGEDNRVSTAAVLVEISEQERKLMGALGIKYDARKHVP